MHRSRNTLTKRLLLHSVDSHEFFFPMILNLCKPSISETPHDKAFYNQRYAKWYISFCVFCIFCILVSSDISCAHWEELPVYLQTTQDSQISTTVSHSHLFSKLNTSCLLAKNPFHPSDHHCILFLDLYQFQWITFSQVKGVPTLQTLFKMHVNHEFKQ